MVIYKLLLLPLGLIVFFGLLLHPDTGMTALRLQEITVELMCQCGCTKVLADCTCGTAADMQAAIQKMIDNGQSKKDILAYYVSQFGEKILSAPTKKGFNLAAWIVPFLAVGAGGTAVYFVVLSWAGPGRKRELPASEEAGPAVVPARLQEQLERDLKSLD